MAQHTRMKRTPYHGEGHELDGKSWFGIKDHYQTGDSIQLLLKGPQPVKGVFWDLRRDAIQVFFDKDSREALSSLSLPFTIAEDGYTWIPRRLILEVAIGAIPLSDTPKMAALKDEMRLGQGDTPAKVRERLKEFLGQHRPNKKDKAE